MHIEVAACTLRTSSLQRLRSITRDVRKKPESLGCIWRELDSLTAASLAWNCAARSVGVYSSPPGQNAADTQEDVIGMQRWECDAAIGHRDGWSVDGFRCDLAPKLTRLHLRKRVYLLQPTAEKEKVVLGWTSNACSPRTLRKRYSVWHARHRLHTASDGTCIKRSRGY